jgi:hypothetical protein
LKLAAVALAAALLAAGCGGGGEDSGDDGGNGGSSGALSKAAYATEGNTICRTTRTQVGALPLARPPTLADLREKTPEARRRVRLWTEYSKKVDEIGRKSQAQLLALVPPKELEERREQLRKDLAELEKAGAKANKAGERLRAAARTGDNEAIEKARAEAQELATDQGLIAQRIGGHFTALGWTACLQGR